MKNTFIYFLGTLTCLMSLLLSACSEDDATGAPYLKISKEELVFGKQFPRLVPVFRKESPDGTFQIC